MKIFLVFIIIIFLSLNIYANNNSYYWYSKGFDQFKANNYKKAINYFLTSYKMQHSVYTFYYIGICLEKIGKKNESLKWFKKQDIKVIDTKIPSFKLEDSVKLKNKFNKLKLFKNDNIFNSEYKFNISKNNFKNIKDSYINNIIKGIVKNKDITNEQWQIISIYMSALKKNNNDVEVLNNISWYLATINKYLDEAESLSKYCCNISNNIICIDTLAKVYESKKDYLNAVKYYKKIINELEETFVHNTDDKYYYSLSRCYFKLKDYKNSFLMLNEAIRLDNKNLAKAKKDKMFNKLTKYFDSNTIFLYEK